MTDGQIRALIFDYGGVLRRTADPRPRRAIERRFDLERGEAEQAVFGHPMWDQVQQGKVSSEAFWINVGDRLQLNEEEMSEFRAAFWAGNRLDKPLLALIRHLRSEGYKTALLSNAPASLRPHLAELGIADAFDEIVISAEEGMSKPDVEIYERTLEQLGVPAAQTVFVDDWGENVTGARQVDLHAFRFRGLAPLRRQLRELGVAVPEPTVDPVPDVQAVIFDWGGVMEPLPDDEHAAEWERRLGLAAGAIPAALWGETWRELAVGAIGNDTYIERVADQLGFPDAAAADRFTRSFYGDGRIHTPVVEAAAALRERYQVALLSNAWPGQDQWIREQFDIDVRSAFDLYVNSAEVGMRKPDPDIFVLTLERLSVEPGQAVFVDDLLPNVDAATELGVHAIQFVDPDTSLATLEAMLGHPIH